MFIKGSVKNCLSLIKFELTVVLCAAVCLLGCVLFNINTDWFLVVLWCTFYVDTLVHVGPPIDISVNPQATRIIAASPYNAITLNCTAFAPVTTATQYRWYLNDSLLLNNTDRVTITDNKESSILTDFPQTHGTLSYTCEYMINTNPPLKRNTSAIVTVHGVCLCCFIIHVNS